MLEYNGKYSLNYVSVLDTWLGFGVDTPPPITKINILYPLLF